MHFVGEQIDDDRFFFVTRLVGVSHDLVRSDLGLLAAMSSPHESEEVYSQK